MQEKDGEGRANVEDEESDENDEEFDLDDEEDIDEDEGESTEDEEEQVLYKFSSWFSISLKNYATFQSLKCWINLRRKIILKSRSENGNVHDKKYLNTQVIGEIVLDMIHSVIFYLPLWEVSISNYILNFTLFFYKNELE